MNFLFILWISFNSQPPEGGWHRHRRQGPSRNRFNSQPPEGGWAYQGMKTVLTEVSTHSRPKAAGS